VRPRMVLLSHPRQRHKTPETVLVVLAFLLEAVSVLLILHQVRSSASAASKAAGLRGSWEISDERMVQQIGAPPAAYAAFGAQDDLRAVRAFLSANFAGDARIAATTAWCASAAAIFGLLATLLAIWG
jgi:hypothetical protein